VSPTPEAYCPIQSVTLAVPTPAQETVTFPPRTIVAGLAVSEVVEGGGLGGVGEPAMVAETSFEDELSKPEVL
jgi:hypothetical protein